MISSAIISADGMYRYELSRIWDINKPIMTFIMLNPSTADTTANDPTIRECMLIAKRWELGGIIVVNLFAFRATKPAEMMRAADPIGPENDKHIIRVVEKSSSVIAAWGGKGSFKNRDEEVVELLKKEFHTSPLLCLGKSPSGFPYHPLGAFGEIHLERYK